MRTRALYTAPRQEQSIQLNTRALGAQLASLFQETSVRLPIALPLFKNVNYNLHLRAFFRTVFDFTPGAC